MYTFQIEVERGERFKFGKNWSKFLLFLDEERIVEAEKSLKNMLRLNDLEGKSFVDVGSGSGLFSLAARRLGAKVFSFDYDPDSVACTKKVKELYFPNDENWKIEEGNVLDRDYLNSLGQFDIVYSWGVLHHTGAMWDALENVTMLIKDGGVLYISIYNKQPWLSKYWMAVKKIYNKSPKFIKFLLIIFYTIYFTSILFLADILRGRNPFTRYSGKGRRGMSVFHDIIDWIGGYPFEVAAPEEIINFYYQRNLTLINLKTCAGKHGCNEYVFIKNNGLKT